MAYLAIFLAAVTWSAHCAGMCGGFAVALGAGTSGWVQNTCRQLAYHAGKTFTYVFLGLVAVRVGLWIREWATWLSVVAGLLLVLIGLQLLGVWRRATRLDRWLSGSPLCQLVGGWMRARSVPGAFAVGMANGFLPCPLVYAMMAYAATLPGWLPAALTMSALGLGTVPVLLALGLTGGWVGRRWMLHKVSGAVLVVLGVVTAARGFDWIHRLLPGASCH